MTERQLFVQCKAGAAGLRGVFVNPAYYSKACSVCACQDSRIKHQFSCSSCGYLAHSDCNAAGQCSGSMQRVNAAGQCSGSMQRVNFAKLAGAIVAARLEVAPTSVAAYSR